MSEMHSGKVTLVSGAASGIGRATALLFAAAGARVTISDIDEGGLAQTAKTILDRGGEVLVVPGDASSVEDIDRVITATVSQFGALDIQVNNAGVFDNFTPLAETDGDMARTVIATNVEAVMFGMKRALREMVPAGGGAIVNLSSFAGLTATGGGPSYTASKHAITGLTRQVAWEAGPYGVRVNAVAPGRIETNVFTNSLQLVPGLSRPGPRARAILDAVRSRDIGTTIPLGRAGWPEEVAAVISFLASEAASYVTGVIVPVDGGRILT